MNKWLIIIGLCFLCIGLFFFTLPKVLDYNHHQNVKKVIHEYHIDNNHSKDDPEGILHIPSVNITEPVYHGPATDEQLKKGLSFITSSESINDHNISIAGHRMEGRHIQFNDLKDVKKGATVYFDINGTKRKYKIDDIKQVSPKDVAVLDETRDNQLTLITCDNYQNGKWLKRLVYIAKEET